MYIVTYCSVHNLLLTLSSLYFTALRKCCSAPSRRVKFATMPPNLPHDTKEGSLEWFVVYMNLRDSGAIPSVTPTTYFPDRCAMARFWGPKASTGWTFDNHGDVIYEYYARSLFNRVLQKTWPLSGVLPFHFARGLMAEALGVDISWAEFGYKMCHPHQSRLDVPRIQPDLCSLTAPLPDLAIVIPRFDLEVSPAHRELQLSIYRLASTPIGRSGKVSPRIHVLCFLSCRKYERAKFHRYQVGFLFYAIALTVSLKFCSSDFWQIP